MPHHFEYVELDWSGGLYSAGDWNVPPNAAAEMLDCYPLPSGGLRAFTRGTTMARTNIGAEQEPISIYIRAGIGFRSGAVGEEIDVYLLTWDPSTKVPKLWRWDFTDDVTPPTGWELIKTFAAGTSTNIRGWFTSFVVTPSYDVHVYLLLSHAGNADQGLWRIQYSDGSVTEIGSGYSQGRGLLVHQDRLLFGTGEANQTRLWYSDPGSETIDPASFIDVLPGYPFAANSFLRSYVGELLIGKMGAPFVLLQGDITDPIARTQAEAQPTGSTTQEVCETEVGVVYGARRSGFWLTRTGAEMQHLSPQLHDNWSEDHMIRKVYNAPYLWTSGAFILDTRTNAWFRSSLWQNTGARAMTVDRFGQPEVFICTQEPNFTIYRLLAHDRDMVRNRTFTYRSFPMRHPTGKLLVIREVQIIQKGVTGTDNNWTVTVGSQDGTQVRTLAGTGTSRESLRFVFDCVGEVLDVKVVPDSGNASREAPIIEAVRVGTLAGHNITAESALA